MPELFANFYFLLFGGITVIVVVGILARTWVVTHRSSAELEMKVQMLQRGMSAEDIERVMAASAQRELRRMLADPTLRKILESEMAASAPPRAGGISGDSLNEVVSALGQVGASPEVIEEVLWAFRATDAPTQEIMSEAVQHLVGSADEVTGEQILAVVRPLRQQRETANGRLVPIHDERIRQDA